MVSMAYNRDLWYDYYAQVKKFKSTEVTMPRKNVTPIFVHTDVFKALREAKIHYEGLTKTHMTWSAWLYALACGALAVSTLAGLTIRCPTCGDHGMQLYYSSLEPKT